MVCTSLIFMWSFGARNSEGNSEFGAPVRRAGQVVVQEGCCCPGRVGITCFSCHSVDVSSVLMEKRLKRACFAFRKAAPSKAISASDLENAFKLDLQHLPGICGMFRVRTRRMVAAESFWHMHEDPYKRNCSASYLPRILQPGYTAAVTPVPSRSLGCSPLLGSLGVSFGVMGSQPPRSLGSFVSLRYRSSGMRQLHA